MTAKLTDWFPPEIPPARIGWYDSCLENNACFARIWWSGRSWKDEPDGRTMLFQSRYWRGLASTPKRVLRWQARYKERNAFGIHVQLKCMQSEIDDLRARLAELEG